MTTADQTDPMTLIVSLLLFVVSLGTWEMFRLAAHAYKILDNLRDTAEALRRLSGTLEDVRARVDMIAASTTKKAENEAAVTGTRDNG